MAPTIVSFLRASLFLLAIPLFLSIQSHAQAPINQLVQLLNESSDSEFQKDILTGISQALEGKQQVPMPQGWERLETTLGKSNDPQVRQLVQSLSLLFGSPRAVETLRTLLLDSQGDLTERRSALKALQSVQDPRLPEILIQLLPDPFLRSNALRALAGFNEPTIPQAILQNYPQYNLTEKRDALQTLTGRLSYAQALLQAISQEQLNPKDLTADLIRQLHNLNDPAIQETIQRVWGSYRDSSENHLKQIENYRNVFRAGGSQPGDPTRGRAVFTRACYQCHTLFGTGGTVGPDLTGSNRRDLDYILQNIVDPNAVIPNDYRTSLIQTRDDQFLTGIIRQQNADSVTLATTTETLLIPRNQIRSLETTEISMMPEGLLSVFNDQEIRDLLVYLRSPSQVPLTATDETINLLFNTLNFDLWDGDHSHWHWDNGEIVGLTTNGLKQNAFLTSQLQFTDFRLIVEVKLTPNTENSGIQFRSQYLESGDVKGYQADVGQGWWGKLYEEHGRALLSEKPGDSYVKTNDWNLYEIVASGDRILTALNGHPCVNLQDPEGARQGFLAFQIHSGGPMEVRYRNFQIELNPKPQLTTPQTP